MAGLRLGYYLHYTTLQGKLQYIFAVGGYLKRGAALSRAAPTKFPLSL
jgi:hypothetical protein